MLQVFQPTDGRHVVGGFDELEHARMPQQLLLGFEHIGDALGAQCVARDQGLRNGALGFLFRQAAQVRRHGIDSGSVELQFQRVVLRKARECVVNDFVQALAIGQGQIEILHQRCQFGGHSYLGSGDDHGAAVGGKLLADIAQAAHDDRIVHVAMKVFEDKDGFDRHRFHVGQSLHGFARVVYGGRGGGACVGSYGGRHGASEPVGFRAAGAERGRAGRPLGPVGGLIDAGLQRVLWGFGRSVRAGAQQAVGDAPLEGRHVEFRAGGSHHGDGVHLLRGLHHHDRSRGVDENFEAIEAVCHGWNCHSRFVGLQGIELRSMDSREHHASLFDRSGDASL